MSDNTKLVIGAILFCSIICVIVLYSYGLFDKKPYKSYAEQQIDSLKAIVAEINRDSSKFVNSNLFLDLNLGDSQSVLYRKLEKSFKNNKVFKDSRGYYYKFKLSFGSIDAVIYPKLQNDSLFMIVLRCFPSDDNFYKSDTLMYFDISELYHKKYGYAYLFLEKEYNDVFVANGIYIEVDLSLYATITYTSKKYALSYYNNKIYEIQHEPIREDSVKNSYLKDI